MEAGQTERESRKSKIYPTIIFNPSIKESDMIE